MKKSEPLLHLLKNRSFVLVTFILILQSFHILSNLIPVLIIFIFCWRALIEQTGRFLPSRWITNLLSVAALVLTYLQFRTFTDLRPTSIFLFTLWGLKALEVRGPRDFKFLTLLCFILICTLTLMESELMFSLPSLFAFYFNWKSQNESFKDSVLWPRAAPVVLFLFFFFPRIQGQFAFKGAEKSSTKVSSGFSDDLHPGNVMDLSQNNELAFRVHFKSSNPTTVDQYYVGQILTVGNGLHWRRSSYGQDIAKEIDPERSQRIPDYTVTLEPHQSRWLFALDGTNYIQSDNFAIYKFESNYYESSTLILEQVSYNGFLGLRKTLSENEISPLWLKLPTLSAGIEKLAKTLSQDTNSRTQKAYRILRYFRQGEFKYSRKFSKPIATLDQFFFEAKRGYCEHYAGATASLLRAMKVPARVVIGYQGGEFNSYGNFWKFTQSDAHAWTEFLNDSNQWERLDPVTVVAPERLDLGGRRFSDIPESEIGQPQSRSFAAKKSKLLFDFLDEFGLAVEGFNYKVLNFLYEFDIEKQKELLNRLGLPTWIAIVLGLLVSALLALILRWLSKAANRNRSNAEYKLIDEILVKYSDKRPAPMSVLKALNQLASLYPKVENKINEVAVIYSRLSFAPLDSKEKERLQKLIKNRISLLRRTLKKETRLKDENTAS